MTRRFFQPPKYDRQDDCFEPGKVYRLIRQIQREAT